MTTENPTQPATLEFWLVPSRDGRDVNLLVTESREIVAAIPAGRPDKQVFYSFCHGLATRGPFRIWWKGRVIAERKPDSSAGPGVFEYDGIFPVDPRNPL